MEASSANAREVDPIDGARFQPRWSHALALIAIVFVVRLIYLIWFCPYELIGDEAYYWMQARHPDLCYNEKGPALAWMIWGCCRVFGDTEWAVRLPVAISFVIAAWAVGRLAMNVARGDERVGFFAVLCFFLLPAFQANAQICTQDGPLIALWVALTAIGLRLARRMRAKQNTWNDWLLLWFTLGVGSLFKHSILLFLASIACYALIERKNWRWNFTLIAQQIAGGLLYLAVISPMIVWNARHGWPMLEHTLGHLGAGGDQTGHVDAGNPLLWLGSLLVGVIFSFGPACIVLMIWSSKRAWTERTGDAECWRDRLWLMCAAWPSLAFFMAIALRKPVVPSWPLPSLVPLVVLIAELVVTGEKRIRQWWNTLAIYGIVGWAIISFPLQLRYLPIVGAKLQKAALARVAGHRADAIEAEKALAIATKPGVAPPLLVTRHYMKACLDSFYISGHPVVTTAGKFLGKRSTTFDQWPDTSLENPRLFGRNLLLTGVGDVPWEHALKFDRIERIGKTQFYLAVNYRGPQPDHPVFGGGED